MCSRQVTRLLVRSASVTKDSALAASCDELSQLAESDARRDEAQHRERHDAALIVAIVCRIWQNSSRIGPSVRKRPPRFSNITETETWHDLRFRTEELPRLLRAQRIPPRVVQWTHVPCGSCASPSSPSHEDGVALLVTRNEVVPARKEFLRAKQTPVPLSR